MKRTPGGRKGNFISNVMLRDISRQSLYQFIIIWYFQEQGKWLFELEGPESDRLDSWKWEENRKWENSFLTSFICFEPEIGNEKTPFLFPFSL